MKTKHSPRIVRTRAALGWALAWCCIALYPGAVFASDLDRLKLAAEEFRANYAAFEAYSCTMQVRCGDAESIEVAVSSGPQENVVEGDASLVVDGSAIAYELTSNDTMRFDETFKTGWMLLSPEVVLADSQFYMFGCSVLGALSVISHADSPTPDRWSIGPEMTTWNGAGANRPGDDGMLDRLLAGLPAPGADVEITDNVERMGVMTMQIDVKWPAGSLRFYVDPSRGYLPIETQARRADSDEPVTSTFITEIREYPGRRWFPTRSVAVWGKRQSEDGGHIVKEVVVTELELGKPEQEAISLSVDAGWVVQSPDVASSQFKLKAPQTITLAELPTFYERLAKGAPPCAVPEPVDAP